MKQKKYALKKLLIKAIGILLASATSIYIGEVAQVRQWAIPFIMLTIYIIQKVILELYKKPSILLQPQKECYTSDFAMVGVGCVEGNNPQTQDEILRKRMELFHQEYSLEQQMYLQQKEREQNIKLEKILKYTRDTFKHLNFDELEIFQLCECVRYLVTNRKVLSNAEIIIHKRTTVTQISLKNFAWNIAYQYNITGDVTTEFIMTTFREWFANSTFDTIRKNLRTTSGKHQIEIDEHII